VSVIRPGKILFELAGVSEAAARECFARVAYKLPVRVRLVGRTH
jgi:large subunit ribosomal protein L16